MAIKNKAPGISISGDLDILKTNTSRAVKELHNNILLLQEQNNELREMMEALQKPPTTEVEAEEETNSPSEDTPPDTEK